MNKRVPLAVFVAVVLITTAVISQPTSVDRPQAYLPDGQYVLTAADSSYLEQLRGVDMMKAIWYVWLDIIDSNRATFPDSSYVLPGKVIELPLHYVYVAHPGGNNHMWDAAEWWWINVAYPYLEWDHSPYPPPTVSKLPDTVGSVVVAVGATDDWWSANWYWAVIAFLAIMVIYLLIRRKPVGEKTEDELTEEEPSNAFDDDPPDFFTATEEEVREATEAAFQQAYGRNFEVLGVEAGWINGRQRVFFKDGTSNVEEYENAEGFCATVRDKKTGKARKLYGLCECMNPLATCIDSDFFGTFTPQGESVSADLIPRITQELSEAICRQIRTGDASLTINDLPGQDVPTEGDQPAAETPTAEPPAAIRADGEITVEKLVVSLDRWTIERFVGTPGQLREVCRDLQKVAPLVSGKAQPATGNGKKEPKAPKAKAPAADTKPAQAPVEAGAETEEDEAAIAK